MRPVILLAAVLLAGCGGQFYVKGGLGWNGSATNSGSEWLGDDALGGRIGGGWRLDLSRRVTLDVNAYHHSAPGLDGDDPETTSEHAFADIEVRF